jgi:MFS family permease
MESLVRPTAARQGGAKARAVQFVILLGVISLFADMTYEGARSITGPYLSILGASATVVGFVAGFGELIGYSLRLVSGYLSDRTRKYWTIVFAGYGVNLFAVPLLALAGRWELAALLMILERTGKAMRTPTRDAMLSHATAEMGRGWGFGLHEAMDQLGAMLGPLIVAGVLYFRGDYRTGFGLLLVPALLAMSVLVAARLLYPRPHELELARPELESKGFPRAFWLYVVAAALVAAGYTDFPLIAYHFEKTSSVPDAWIPIFYAVAMGVAALAALVFGRLFDRVGLSILIAAAVLSALFAPLVFLGGFGLALLGMALWGVGMGAQESVMRAAVAGMVPTDRRGTAYGLFNTGYGVCWFAGSVVMGVLYDRAFPALIGFSVILQLASVPVLLLVWRLLRRSGGR